jgi:hypothetical protein
MRRRRLYQSESEMVVTVDSLDRINIYVCPPICRMWSTVWFLCGNDLGFMSLRFRAAKRDFAQSRGVIEAL